MDSTDISKVCERLKLASTATLTSVLRCSLVCADVSFWTEGVKVHALVSFMPEFRF